MSEWLWWDDLAAGIPRKFSLSYSTLVLIPHERNKRENERSGLATKTRSFMDVFCDFRSINYNEEDEKSIHHDLLKGK